VEKYIRMSISELDVSTWQRCSPSYVLLPANYPKLTASGRTPLGLALFNDEWVSVTSGSEDYSFKHYRKNQYEEALFRAEDDHFELDMIIAQNASAIKALQPLAAALEGMSEEERAGWQLPEKALRAFHYRAVQRIYGEQGAQVVALLRQNPAVAVPTVLNRLTQKDVEWRQVRRTPAGWQLRRAS
jgi:paired amphipathic helix protein Sin3a